MDDSIDTQDEGETIACVDCKENFIFTDGEKEFYESKGLTVPKRCKPCRAEKKRKNEDKAFNNKAKESGYSDLDSF